MSFFAFACLLQLVQLHHFTVAITKPGMALDNDIELQARSRSSHSITQSNNDTLEQVVVDSPRMPHDRAKHTDSETNISADFQDTGNPGCDNGEVPPHVPIVGASEGPTRDTNGPSTAPDVAGSSPQPRVDEGDTSQSRPKRSFFGMNRPDRAYGTSQPSVAVSRIIRSSLITLPPSQGL